MLHTEFTTPKRSPRATLAWLAAATVGLAFTVGPVFTHAELGAAHIAAHLVTGPALVALALFQLREARKGRWRRGIEVTLLILGVWLALLPYVLPAPGLHIPAHVASGALVAIGAAWNASVETNGGSAAGQCRSHAHRDGGC